MHALWEPTAKTLLSVDTLMEREPALIVYDTDTIIIVYEEFSSQHAD